jgi:hypothetical protein
MADRHAPAVQIGANVACVRSLFRIGRQDRDARREKFR